jgi:hypothetical protein
LYPRYNNTQQPQGSPIADRYAIRHFANATVASIADGCGWGNRPRLAATAAQRTFIEYVSANTAQANNVTDVADVLARAFAAAHQAIRETDQTPGTTTLLGGIVLESSESNNQLEFVCVSVGECKALRYDLNARRVVEITQNAQRNDARDPGGRLGPFQNGDPDLRNLDAFSSSCNHGDIIIMLTDGVYENFDPEVRGLRPRDLPGLVGDLWNAVDQDAAANAKNAFRNNLIAQMCESNDVTGIGNALVEHVRGITHEIRTHLEAHPELHVAQDYFELAGKMDHCTALVFRAGPARLQ